MTVDYRFAGFERRSGRLLARFHGADGDTRCVALPGCPVAGCEDELPLSDPQAQRELVARAQEWLALARTAHIAQDTQRERPPTRFAA